MAFKLDLSTKYRWPVTVRIPGEDGKPEDSTFHLDFKRMSQSEVEGIVKEFTAQKDDDPTVQKPSMTDQDFLDRVLVGWYGPLEADGAEIPFSREAVLRVCDIIGVRAAMVRAWFESIREGAAKNSN